MGALVCYEEDNQLSLCHRPKKRSGQVTVSQGGGGGLERGGLCLGLGLGSTDVKVLVLDKVAWAARRGHGVSTRERIAAGQICLGQVAGGGLGGTLEPEHIFLPYWRGHPGASPGT